MSTYNDTEPQSAKGPAKRGLGHATRVARPEDFFDASQQRMAKVYCSFTDIHHHDIGADQREVMLGRLLRGVRRDPVVIHVQGGEFVLPKKMSKSPSHMMVLRFLNFLSHHTDCGQRPCMRLERLPSADFAPNR